MSVTVIVELRAKPGQRDALRARIEHLAATERPSGYLGSTYFEAVDDPDLLIDLAGWESPEARTRHLEASSAAGTYGPVMELVAGPARTTVIRQLP